MVMNVNRQKIVKVEQIKKGDLEIAFNILKGSV